MSIDLINCYTNNPLEGIKPYGYKKLTPEVKEAWLRALRSRGRRQAEGVLRRRDENGKLSYCCLGVLCDLGKDAKKKWTREIWSPSSYISSGLHYDYDGRPKAGYEGLPPAYVLKRAGLNKKTAEILAEANDNGASFKQIADWIEEYL